MTGIVKWKIVSTYFYYTKIVIFINFSSESAQIHLVIIMNIFKTWCVVPQNLKICSIFLTKCLIRPSLDRHPHTLTHPSNIGGWIFLPNTKLKEKITILIFRNSSNCFSLWLHSLPKILANHQMLNLCLICNYYIVILFYLSHIFLPLWKFPITSRYINDDFMRIPLPQRDLQILDISK